MVKSFCTPKTQLLHNHYGQWAAKWQFQSKSFWKEVMICVFSSMHLWTYNHNTLVNFFKPQIFEVFVLLVCFNYVSWFIFLCSNLHNKNAWSILNWHLVSNLNDLDDGQIICVFVFACVLPQEFAVAKKFCKWLTFSPYWLDIYNSLITSCLPVFIRNASGI